MSAALDARSAIESIAIITKSCIQLSHSLYDIGSGLVGSSIAPVINTIAQEFAELANLAQQLSELLRDDETVYTNELLEDAGKSLSRLDLLVNYFEDAITGLNGPRISRELRDLFKESRISDLTWYCRSVKEPLQLQISQLRIAAYERQRVK